MTRRFAMVAVLALCAGLGGADDAAAPQITIEPNGFDFGRVLPNKTVEKLFSVRNTGTADLVVERVQTSCGCTSAFVGEKAKAGQPTVIKPGEREPLRVMLSTPGNAGRVAKSVLIQSNVGKAPTELKIEATVVPEEK